MKSYPDAASRSGQPDRTDRTGQLDQQGPVGQMDTSGTGAASLSGVQWVLAGLIGLCVMLYATWLAPHSAMRRTAVAQGPQGPAITTVATGGVHPAPRGPILGAPARARQGATSSLDTLQAKELEDEFRRGYPSFGPAASANGAAPAAPPLRVLRYSLTEPDPAAPDQVKAEWRMLNAINDERARNGLQTLVPDAALAAVARWRSDDMAARNYFSHDIGGYLVFDVLRTQGYSYQAAGENLAYNYSPADQSVQAAHTALMNSPGHRANILRPDFTHAGIGLAVVADGRRIYTQLFSKLGGERDPAGTPWWDARTEPLGTPASPMW